METEVTCPDCGKVIAPPGAVDNTLRCRCGEQRGPKVSVEEVSTRPRISVPVPPIAPKPAPAMRAPTADDSDTPSVSARPEKKCYVCGTSLEGRTRLKDHLGRYWCKECAAADERAKKREDELRCPDCGRVFPEHKLQYFQTERVCATCYKAREKELERKILKANLNKVEKTHEWESVKRLAIIVGVLLLLGTIGLLIHGFH